MAAPLLPTALPDGTNSNEDTMKAVWLDCDPGHDDALAIILAGFHSDLQLLGISTVAGNQSLKKVTDNALRVLSAAGLEHIPVVAGQNKPLMRPPLHCPSIHGESGLDGPFGGPVLPPSSVQAVPGKAVLVMFEALRSSCVQRGGCKSTLVATGALTNVALLLQLFPEVVDMVEVVIMGGCLGLGNTGPVVVSLISLCWQLKKKTFIHSFFFYSCRNLIFKQTQKLHMYSLNLECS